MRKIKLLKPILISTLGISAIWTIAAISTSCACNSIKVQEVTLNNASTTLTVGQIEQLDATVSPDDATNKDVTWTSSDTNIATIKNGTITAKGLGKAIITVTSVDNQNAEATCEVNVTNPYVAIAANENSTLELKNLGGNNPNLQYSTDGINWSLYSTTTVIHQGQVLYLRGNNITGWSHSNNAYSVLYITGNVSISGNIMALLDDGTNILFSIPCDCCFYKLFEDSTGITNVNDGFLPATSLKCGCYSYMFHFCSSLAKAPALSATTLAEDCYSNMFQDCSSLTTAPKLPATELADSCYYGMFDRCSSLTTAPELPAITLKNNCYFRMFQNCVSLQLPPKLNSKIIASFCYSFMFSGCISLTVTPDLPAASLTESCYSYMFQNCSSLNSIKIGYIGDYDPDYFGGWVDSVTSSGIFHYNGSQTAQHFQLPSGWTTEHF